jgi:DNA-binding beta-propeller fold protein YncE
MAWLWNGKQRRAHMKKIGTSLLASLMLLALSAPAWGHGTSQSKRTCKTNNDTHHHQHWQHHRPNPPNPVVLRQFQAMKEAYNRSNEGARQMFLEYLESSLPGSNGDVEKVREEYDQQIAQLNETIASQQQKIDELNATIASQHEQLGAQDVAHQAEMVNLTTAMTQQCDERVDTAYNQGMTAGTETCTNTSTIEDLQQVDSWSTDFWYPYGVDVDANGNTYILDKINERVVGYDSTGSQIAQWTVAALRYPVDLAFDSNGDIFILDQGSTNFLRKFSPNGDELTFATSGIHVAYPTGLFVDNQDNIYVTDLGVNSGRILKFDPATGAWRATFGEVTDGDLLDQEYSDVAVDEANQMIYIVTRGNHMVAKFTMDGEYLGAWQGDLNNPNSIAIGPLGQVFVADTDNNQIDQYDADGNLISTISSDQLLGPTHIAVDRTGKLYIAMESNHWIQVYQ